MRLLSVSYILVLLLGTISACSQEPQSPLLDPPILPRSSGSESSSPPSTQSSPGPSVVNSPEPSVQNQSKSTVKVVTSTWFKIDTNNYNPKSTNPSNFCSVPAGTELEMEDEGTFTQDETHVKVKLTNPLKDCSFKEGFFFAEHVMFTVLPRKIQTVNSQTNVAKLILTARTSTVLKPIGRAPNASYKQSELCFVPAGTKVKLKALVNLATLKEGHYKVELAEPLSAVENSTGTPTYANSDRPCSLREVYIFAQHFNGIVIDENSKCCNFPLKKEPRNYCDDGRAFGAYRDYGRLHAACDLLAPAGTTIYAIADGVVIQSPYAFYLGTDALEIKHPEVVNGNGEILKNAVVRYGEIAPWSARNISTGKPFQAGDRIKRGQEIARVGVLLGYDAFMLHFELYKGSKVGQLTTEWGEYQRRDDLLNPTSLLKRWVARLP